MSKAISKPYLPVVLWITESLSYRTNHSLALVLSESAAFVFAPLDCFALSGPLRICFLYIIFALCFISQQRQDETALELRLAVVT